MSRKKDIFIKKAKDAHGDKYDYSKVDYIDSQTKVCIICPEHGEFWQTPASHVRGYKCPSCGNLNRGSKKRWNTEKFINESVKVHGNKYIYSNVKYINGHTKICIICPEHGEFWQLPISHIKGQGCPICAGKNMDTKQFIKNSKKIHGDKYDYSKVDYIDSQTKVCIICPEHGEFWQTPAKHLLGQGCNLCGYKYGKKKKVSTNEFIERANVVHNNKYDYSFVEYNTVHNKVKIICPKHGMFKQIAYDHLNGHGCPKCGIIFSKSENEIYEYVKTIVGEENVIKHDRLILKGKEIDIYIPSLKIAIEYNGLLWHSQKYNKDKNYHLNKTESCKKQGIKLIQIFEDEYVNNKDIVLSKIAYILGKCENLPKIMARKCEIKEVTTDIAKPFLDKNHIQGFGSGTIYLGAYYNDLLMGIMAFKKEKDVWELTRFASNNQYVCQGIGGKLFKYFVTHYNPVEIKSFADRRWTVDEENNLYIKLGFEFDGYVEPDYKYYNPEDGCKRQHKFGFRKARLNKKYGLPLTMTESEMTEKLGYIKVYDAGLIRYVWKRKQ